MRVLLLCALIIGESAAYTTRSYDLEVPGSSPIRIIEADPIWDEFRGARLEHRTLKPETVVKTPDKITDREDSELDETPENLKDFLDNYAQKFKRRPGDRDEDDEMYLKDSEEETSKHEKSKAWNYDRHHAFDDRKGWVSMDAVPWSMSKISKWHNKQNNVKPYLDNDRYYNRPSQEAEYSDYSPTYSKPQRPKPQYPKPSYSSENDDEDDYYNNKRPQFDRPMATYGQTVHIRPVPEYDSHKPSWNKRPQQDNCNQNQQPHYHHHHQGDIITDGLPADFPDHNQDPYGNRRRGTSADLQPATHPFKGDGEWVLMSTTKGYKRKNRQRSLQMSPNTDNSIDAHRSVRLTVLPPLNDGRVNMTTSHGGLLQVESTFQTVEEAHRDYKKKQKLKIRNSQRKPTNLKLRAPLIPTTPTPNNYQHRYQIHNTKDGGSDTASVLAAVGAGMIPASMALFVPMAMNGRKRRELFGVTSNPYDQVEIQLPSSSRI